MILAGDIGGTKTHVALFTVRHGHLTLLHEHRVISRHYPSLEALIKTWLTREHGRVTAACFGVAGPVMNGRCVGTNLPWVIDANVLRRALNVKSVSLINDLSALAYGIETLPPKAFLTLNRGTPQLQGTIAVIAAGTGLGEATLVWDDRRYRAIPSEGGHVDFAPRTDLEVELYRHLRSRFGRVSYERIVSGPGKVNVYDFLKQTGRFGKEPSWLVREFKEHDKSAVISKMALNGRSPLCKKALDLFVSIYGAEAGNLALKTLATGGVYIGGGIAPTILQKLKSGAFMKAFKEKGRLSSLLSRIPVRVILEQKVALFGAAHYAARHNAR